MELFENGLILRRLEPSCVSFQHRRNGFCGVIVGLEFVVSLLGMKAFAGDVLLPLVDQEIADALEHGDYNFFLKVMPLYVKVGIVGGNTQLCELFFQGLYAGNAVTVVLLKFFHLSIHFPLQVLERLFGSPEFEVAELDGAEKVGHGESVVAILPIAPDIPDKERIDDS